MGHGKETPRQKMIGMMYLVLTALLALNVAKSVLDAFINVDEGLQNTIKNYTIKNQSIYKDFAQQAELNPAKVKELYKTALEVKKQADEIYGFINVECKQKIVLTSEGEETEAIHHDEDGHIFISVQEIKIKDNTTVPSEIMWGTAENNGQGKILKEMIDKFREYCIENISEEDSSVVKSINRSLNTRVEGGGHGGHGGHGEGKDNSALWVSNNFEHLPLAGVIAILSGIQTNIRNAESDMVMYLYNKVSASDMKFNKVDAITIPNSNYIIRGNEYTANIFIAASDSTQKPKIFISDKKFYEERIDKNGNLVYDIKGTLGKDYDTIPVDGGIGKYKKVGSSTGERKYYGIIELTNLNDGTKLRRSFENSYTVAQANLVVSPTKMNVFYLGVDNPVKVSVPGVGSDKIKPTINNGSMPKYRGNYVVRPRKVGKAVVTVYAEIDGNKKRMGSVDFRVKDIPPPVAKVGGSKGGTIQKSTLQVQRYVVAEMENFDFELKVNVTQFTVSASIGGFLQEISTKGNKITAAQTALIKKVGRNQRVYFQDIKAKTPAGIKDLSTITFKVQ